VLGAVTAYNVSLFLHITAVVVGFGVTFVEAFTYPLAGQLGPQHLPFVHRLGLLINKWVAPPAMVIVLATGFYLVAEGNWSLGAFWISATLLIAVVILGLGGAYFIRVDRRMIELADSAVAAAGSGEPVITEEHERLMRQHAIVGVLTGVLIILAVFLMTAKPGA
jgi:uncharacterized membrane protein